MNATRSKQRTASRRRAQTALRNAVGAFVRRFDRLALHSIVVDVAQAAAEKLQKPAVELTVVEWNAHRRLLHYRWPMIPAANEVCRQLANIQGEPHPWRRLLEVALDPTTNIEMYDAAWYSTTDRPPTMEEATHALQRVAFAGQVRTLGPEQYERGSATLLAQARNPGERRRLAELLPTLQQILALFDNNWGDALSAAGLDPRPPQPAAPRGKSAAEAIVLYFREHAEQPSSIAALKRFASGKFRLSRISGHVHDHIDRAQQIASSEGLPPIPPTGEKITDWTPQPIAAGKLPAPIQDVTEAELLEWIRRYHVWKKTKKSNVRLWRAFAEAEGAPSLSRLNRSGGLNFLLLEIGRADAEVRAARREDARTNHVERARQRRQSRRRAAPRELGHREQAILDALSEGPRAVTDLANAMGVTRQNIGQAMRRLADRGLVEQTEANARSSKQRWCLVQPYAEPPKVA